MKTIVRAAHRIDSKWSAQVRQASFTNQLTRTDNSLAASTTISLPALHLLTLAHRISLPPTFCIDSKAKNIYGRNSHSKLYQQQCFMREVHLSGSTEESVGGVSLGNTLESHSWQCQTLIHGTIISFCPPSTNLPLLPGYSSRSLDSPTAEMTVA